MSDISNVFNDALAALNNRDVKRAEERLRQVIRLDRSNVPALNLLTVVLMSMGRFSDAEPFVAAAISLNQNSDISFYNYGLISKQMNKPRQALEQFNKALELNPNVPDTWNNRGTVFNDLEEYELAVSDFDRAIALNQGYAEAYTNKGKALAQTRRYNEAFAAYDKALSIKPNLAEAWLGRGNVFAGLSRHEEALAAYDRALSIKTNLADAWLGRGNVFANLKRYEEAFAAYDRALSIKPDLEGAWLRRGDVFWNLQRYDEAFAAYDKALSIAPNLAEAWLGRGNVFWNLQRYDEASAAYDKALSITPNLAEAWLGRGNVLCVAKCYEDALAAYGKVLEFNPGAAEAWLGRGNAFCGSRRWDEALSAYETALVHNSNLAEAWLCRGNALFEINLVESAAVEFKRALAIKPDCAEARFAQCFATLPVLYANAEEIVQRRTAYEQELRALCNDVDSGSVRGDLAKAIGFKLPFYLAYQGLNDVKLQRLYGSLVTRVIESQYPPVSLPPPPTPDEPVRVGIVSNFFFSHSNWKIPIKGWISQLDRKRFKIFGYHTGSTRDAETDIAAALCDRFVHRVLPLSGWREEILADAPHALIYPGLLMDSISIGLAAQRLAPVQCNSWGHPETSGLPTVDYYLSSDLMEPPDADQHYSERVIRLPNLSIYYEPVDVQTAATSKAELGLCSAVVFWCGQSLFKYLPQFDQVLPKIVERAPDCQFVFLRHDAASVTDLFRERLERAFASSRLRSSDYCILLPRLSFSQFFAAMGQCDIFLDSIGWSGCNSTLESLPHNLPIVTMSGSLMRGRHSSAILQMMGITETIASSVEDYISIAVRLANHPDERKALSRKIADAKHRVYRDRACISALEKFLDRAARDPYQTRKSHASNH